LKRTLALAALLMFTSACQNLGSLQSPGGLTRVSSETSGRLRQTNPPCTDVTDHRSIKKKGGKETIPGIPGSTFAGGPLRYAPMTQRLYTLATFYTCLYNYFGVPVPSGYTPDWFGAWTICGDNCEFSFESANLDCYIESYGWVPGTAYYLYLYQAHSGQFIESYEMGPLKVTKKGAGIPTLHFESPFENGFTWPANDFVAFEIVHPS